MKTQQFYQTTKPSKREATLLDLAKGFGYCAAVFVVVVGGTLAIVLIAGGCEALANLFKQKDMKKSFCVSSNYTPSFEDDEELQTREEYTQKTKKMILSETRDLVAKIKGSSLSDIEKRVLIKDSIAILLNRL